jgi:hypothetical protein
MGQDFLEPWTGDERYIHPHGRIDHGYIRLHQD